MKRKWVQIRSAGEEMLMEGVNHARDLKATSIIPAAVAVVLVGVLVAAYPSLPPSLQVASRIVLQIRYAASGFCFNGAKNGFADLVSSFYAGAQTYPLDPSGSGPRRRREEEARRRAREQQKHAAVLYGAPVVRCSDAMELLAPTEQHFDVQEPPQGFQACYRPTHALCDARLSPYATYGTDVAYVHMRCLVPTLCISLCHVRYWYRVFPFAMSGTRAEDVRMRCQRLPYQGGRNVTGPKPPTPQQVPTPMQCPVLTYLSAMRHLHISYAAPISYAVLPHVSPPLYYRSPMRCYCTLLLRQPRLRIAYAYAAINCYAVSAANVAHNVRPEDRQRSIAAYCTSSAADTPDPPLAGSFAAISLLYLPTRPLSAYAMSVTDIGYAATRP
eukprot:1784090-Rhodomonas_salina.1